MKKCSYKDCGQEATRVVKMQLYCTPAGPPATVFATIFACSAAHEWTDEGLREFFTANWERLATGFEVIKLPRPIFELAKWAWVPIAEAEEFWNEHDQAPAEAKKEVKTQ